MVKLTILFSYLLFSSLSLSMEGNQCDSDDETESAEFTLPKPFNEIEVAPTECKKRKLNEEPTCAVKVIKVSDQIFFSNLEKVTSVEVVEKVSANEPEVFKLGQKNNQSPAVEPINKGKIYKYFKSFYSILDNDRKCQTIYLYDKQLWLSSSPPDKFMNLPPEIAPPLTGENYNNPYENFTSLWLAKPNGPWELYIVTHEIKRRLTEKTHIQKLGRIVNTQKGAQENRFLLKTGSDSENIKAIREFFNIILTNQNLTFSKEKYLKNTCKSWLALLEKKL